VQLTAAQEVALDRPEPTPTEERPPVELAEAQLSVIENSNPTTTPEAEEQISPKPISRCRVNKLLITLDVCHGQNRSLDHEAIAAATNQGVPVLLFISSGAFASPHQYLTENDITFIKDLQEQGLVIVGSHGHLHLDAAKVSLQEWEEEVKTSVELLTPLFGRPIYFRYPFDTAAQLGELEKRQIVTQYGMAIISHSFETGDPAGYSAERIYQAFKGQGQANDIIIGHANIPHISHTREALPKMIEYAQKRGWQFTHPDECLSGKE
jgi:peptidoglycan/xylan/chitin deacetylase (PgdA/CDA1 family)